MAESAASGRRRRGGPEHGGTLRDEQRRLTRRRLADAALELFHEQGYAATTAEQIATRAGANRATFYLHFGGKADVVLELMRRVDDEVAGIFARLDAIEDPSRDDVRAWVEETVGFWERHRVLIDANEQALGVEPRVAAYWAGGLERAVDAMPRLLGRQEGEDRARMRVRLIALMLGLERLCYFWIVCRTPLDPVHVLDALTDEWWAVVGPGAGG
jgi:AcrR family transcriptional regulator